MAPLPNSIDTLPATDYPVGARVLALYPDTSCFYWATVQGGGPKLTGKSRSKVCRVYILTQAHKARKRASACALQCHVLRRWGRH